MVDLKVGSRVSVTAVELQVPRIVVLDLQQLCQSGYFDVQRSYEMSVDRQIRESQMKMLPEYLLCLSSLYYDKTA